MNASRIVCAAIRHESGLVICGPRHYDKAMNRQVRRYPKGVWIDAEQGFVDQFGEFYNRREAFWIALENNQIFRRVGGDEVELFSENLY